MQVTVEALPESSRPSPGQEPDNAPLSAPSPNQIQHLSIAKRYNIDSPTQEESKKLAEVWDYAKSKSETKEMDDIIWQVIHLEGVLGAPRIGESKLDKLYRYAKLSRQAAQINEELKDVSNSVNIR